MFRSLQNSLPTITFYNDGIGIGPEWSCRLSNFNPLNPVYNAMELTKYLGSKVQTALTLTTRAPFSYTLGAMVFCSQFMPTFSAELSHSRGITFSDTDGNGYALTADKTELSLTMFNFLQRLVESGLLMNLESNQPALSLWDSRTYHFIDSYCRIGGNFRINLFGNRNTTAPNGFFLNSIRKDSERACVMGSDEELDRYRLIYTVTKLINLAFFLMVAHNLGRRARGPQQPAPIDNEAALDGNAPAPVRLSLAAALAMNEEDKNAPPTYQTKLNAIKDKLAKITHPIFEKELKQLLNEISTFEAAAKGPISHKLIETYVTLTSGETDNKEDLEGWFDSAISRASAILTSPTGARLLEKRSTPLKKSTTLHEMVDILFESWNSRADYLLKNQLSVSEKIKMKPGMFRAPAMKPPSLSTALVPRSPSIRCGDRKS